MRGHEFFLWRWVPRLAMTRALGDHMLKMPVGASITACGVAEKSSRRGLGLLISQVHPDGSLPTMTTIVCNPFVAKSELKRWPFSKNRVFTSPKWTDMLWHVHLPVERVKQSDRKNLLRCSQMMWWATCRTSLRPMSPSRTVMEGHYGTYNVLNIICLNLYLNYNTWHMVIWWQFVTYSDHIFGSSTVHNWGGQTWSNSMMFFFFKLCSSILTRTFKTFQNISKRTIRGTRLCSNSHRISSFFRWAEAGDASDSWSWRLVLKVLSGWKDWTGWLPRIGLSGSSDFQNKSIGWSQGALEVMSGYSHGNIVIQRPLFADFLAMHPKVSGSTESQRPWSQCSRLDSVIYQNHGMICWFWRTTKKIPVSFFQLKLGRRWFVAS